MRELRRPRPQERANERRPLFLQQSLRVQSMYQEGEPQVVADNLHRQPSDQ